MRKPIRAMCVPASQPTASCESGGSAVLWKGATGRMLVLHPDESMGYCGHSLVSVRLQSDSIFVQ
jgi:hypothetical protein